MEEKCIVVKPKMTSHTMEHPRCGDDTPEAQMLKANVVK